MLVPVPNYCGQLFIVPVLIAMFHKLKIFCYQGMENIYIYLCLCISFFFLLARYMSVLSFFL